MSDAPTVIVSPIYHKIIVAGGPGPGGTVSLGTVTTGAADSDVVITNTGTPGAAVLNFQMPRGLSGQLFLNGTITGAPGTPASVINTGTPEIAHLTFTVPRGYDGAPGAKGDKGDKGDTGVTGATGATGATGPQGPQGDRGSKGEVGLTGPQGPQGERGYTGAQGDTGPQGIKGDKGDKGDRGDQGPMGPTGPAGANGTNGTNGVGVPSGGTTGQVLAKTSSTDYATGWASTTSGGNGSADVGKLTTFGANGSLTAAWFQFPDTLSANGKVLKPLIYPPHMGAVTVGADAEIQYLLPTLADDVSTYLARTTREDGLVEMAELADFPGTSSGGYGSDDAGKILTFGPIGEIYASQVSSQSVSGADSTALTLSDTSLVFTKNVSGATDVQASLVFPNTATGNVTYEYNLPTKSGTVALTSDLPTFSTGLTNTSGTITVSFGTTSGTVCQGNDSRLSNARTPTTHASTHATGGADAITPDSIGAAMSRVYKTSGFTAATKGRYACNGTFTVSDPGSATTGDFYDILIEGGTVTIAGTNYTASRFPLHRWYNGSTWATLTPAVADNMTLNGTHNTAPNQVGVVPTTGDFLVLEQSKIVALDQMRHGRRLFGSASLSASGTGATARRTTANSGCFDGDISTSAGANAYLGFSIIGGSLDNTQISGGTSVLNPARAWTLYTKAILSIPANVNFLTAIGCDARASGIPASGNHIGFIVDSTSRVRIWKCISGTVTYSTPDGTMTNLVSTGYATGFHHFWLENTGSGTINLYVAYAAFGSAVPDKPSSATCTISTLPSTLDASARIDQILRTTGTPGATAYCGLGDALFME